MLSSELNSILPLLDNSDRDFAITNVLAQGELHSRVIWTRLTPKLGLLTTVLRDELYYAMEIEFPKCTQDAWTPVGAYPLLHAVVGRMAARAFVGPKL